MEQELNQVRHLMEGLSTQGSKLSETMQSMKPPTVSDDIPARARGEQSDDWISFDVNPLKPTVAIWVQL